MLINVMRAKLHRLTVTQADLNYIGSISSIPISSRLPDLWRENVSKSSTSTTANASRRTSSQVSVVPARFLNGLQARSRPAW